MPGSEVEAAFSAHFRGRRCVGQDNDRRLKPLGAMNRHDPDFAAPLIHFPFDLTFASREIVDKTRQ